ncbi:MAG: M20/M25/M40 family metallo-hydrolase [Planctomycetota bacterium]
MNLREFLEKSIADMVAIPSLSGNEAAMADYVMAELRREGLPAERDDQDNVFCRVGTGTRRLHINAHTDTVPAVPGWATDPLVPVVKGDCLYGLGATDCKAGLAAMLWLAPRIRPSVEVVFSFTVCEEAEVPGRGNGARRAAARGGDWAITAEPSCDAEGPRLSLGTQAHALAEVVFRGKASHSARPERGINAITAAARFCAAVDETNRRYPEVEIRPGAIARGSMAATLISGGRRNNIIPDECRVTVSRRLAPGEDGGTLRGELERILAGEDASFTIRARENTALTDLNGALFAAARGAMIAQEGRERYGFQRGRTDLTIFAGAGMDVLNLGPGFGGSLHCVDEFVNLPVAARCVTLLERIILALPG